jgi:preprotein translocase subunit SecG
METVLLVVHVMISLALIGMVLIQRSESDGFGLGSGGGSNFMTGRAAANLLTRTTAILATLFIINSLALGIIASHKGSASITDVIAEEESATPTTNNVEKKEEATKPAEDKAAKKPEKPKATAKEPSKKEPSVPTDK